MSKIFMIGDSHAYIYPLNYQKWMNTFKDYFYNFYIPLLKREAKEGDICIHLGDLFDNRNLVPIDVLVDVQKIVEEISKILPLHILIGNHDLFTKSEGEYNLPKVYKHIPNVFVYENTTQISFNNQKLLMMPWVEEKKDQIELLRKYRESDYVFCHSDLNGAKLHMKSVAHKNRDKIDIEEFNSFKHVYSAHIHIHQVSNNFTFIGSIYEMDRGDMGSKKGVTILDTNTGEERFINNDLSPKFKVLNILSESDVDKLEDIDTSKNYIDLKISNSLLINSRKVRRKLESIIQKNSFSDVEYINDIVNESRSEVKEIALIKELDLSNISITDFEKIVNEYVNSLSFDSEAIKEGVIKEMNNVFQIYNTTYKMKIEE